MRTPNRSFFINALALSGGIAIFVLVLLKPWTVAAASPGLRETLFALMVISSALGFAFGLGFRAKTGVFRFVFSPVTVFAAIVLALCWITYAIVVGYDKVALHDAAGYFALVSMHDLLVYI